MITIESDPLNNPLYFPLVANNDALVTLHVKAKDGTQRNFTGYTVEWGMFLNGNEVLPKSTGTGGIIIPDQTIITNLSTVQLIIAAADTINFETEIFYDHDFVFTDPFGKVSNVRKGDLALTVGKCWLTRQLKAQGS